MGIYDSVTDPVDSIVVMVLQNPEMQVPVCLYHNVVNVCQSSMGTYVVGGREANEHGLGKTLVMSMGEGQTTIFVIDVGKDKIPAVLSGGPDIFITEKAGGLFILTQNIVIYLFTLAVHLLWILQKVHIGSGREAVA